jgi:hypothetical protein
MSRQIFVDKQYAAKAQAKADFVPEAAKVAKNRCR